MICILPMSETGMLSYSANHTLTLLCSHAYTATLHVTAQQMVTGHSPWSALHFRSLVDLAKDMEQHRLPPVPSCLSDDLQHLLRSCFTWAPCERPTARELLMHDFCRAVHCQKCVGESSCDDHGYDGACCDDSGSSCSDSRRSSDCSDSSVDTQTVSSESSYSSGCSTQQSSPSHWPYCAPASLRSEMPLEAGGRHGAAHPSAYWSDSVIASTAAAPKDVSSNSTAAVLDEPHRKDASVFEEASARAAGSFPSSNPFAGRTRVAASANLVCARQTTFGTAVFEPTVAPVVKVNTTPFAGSYRVAQMQSDPNSRTAAACFTDGGGTATTTTTTKTKIVAALICDSTAAGTPVNSAPSK
jgi:serine/threonine protein kinase